MYEYIKGEVAELTPAYAVVDAAGVGYYIIISLQTYSELENKKTAKVYIHYHLVTRSDTLTLYGFASKQERELFRLLISVSGVGGATARMVLSTYSPQEIVNIVASANAGLLSNVKGLGKKTSEKIIIELRDKIDAVLKPSEEIATSGSGHNYEEALSALTMLGFTKRASEKTLTKVMKDNPSASVEDIIRISLKSL